MMELPKSIDKIDFPRHFIERKWETEEHQPWKRIAPIYSFVQIVRLVASLFSMKFNLKFNFIVWKILKLIFKDILEKKSGRTRPTD